MPDAQQRLRRSERENPDPESWKWGLGPLSEAGVGLVCQECSFQTADERKADAHNALTGHAIAVDYIGHESPWPGEEDS